LLEESEALAAETVDGWLEQQACGESAERTEGQCEANLVAKLGDGRAGGWVGELGEMVVVLEEGEAASLLGVLEEGFGGDVVWAAAGEIWVRRDEGGDEGVVLGGQAELPSAPDYAAVGGDVA
jgi:hypothetical protein